MENTIFDFSGVQAPTSNDYITPGQYNVDTIASTFTAPDGKSPYMETIFTNTKGLSVKRKFFITAKAMKILQYVHEQIMGTALTKAFNSSEEVANYFGSIFKGYSAKKTKNRLGMVVGRTQAANGKTYANLIAFNFLVNLSEDKSFVEKEFTDEDFAKNPDLTMIDNYKGEQTSESGTFVGETATPVFEENEVSDDLPF